MGAKLETVITKSPRRATWVLATRFWVAVARVEFSWQRSLRSRVDCSYRPSCESGRAFCLRRNERPKNFYSRFLVAPLLGMTMNEEEVRADEGVRPYVKSLIRQTWGSGWQHP